MGHSGCLHVFLVKFSNLFVNLIVGVFFCIASLSAQTINHELCDDGVEEVETLIFCAGNLKNESDRYRVLEYLQQKISPESELYAELSGLLPIIDQWANGKSNYWEPGDQQQSAEDGYLAGFFNLRSWPSIDTITLERSRFLDFFRRLIPTYPARIYNDSPLYPIWCLYRGRMLIQQPIQTSIFAKTSFTRNAFFGEGRALLAEAGKDFPLNPSINLYLNKHAPWPAYESYASAPEWAVLQREALGKLNEIINFWIDERQAPDGQFGGGWGDDIEMWRNWTPILLGFNDSKSRNAHTQLVESLMALPRLEDGFTHIMTDVEHSAEDTGDSLTSMLLLNDQDERWIASVNTLAHLMNSLWLGENEQGLTQFKSTYITSSTVSTNTNYACDTSYHSRVVQPLLLHWQRSGAPEVGNLITGWLTNWVEATKREERGKPQGVIPTAIHWPSGLSGGKNDNWWQPGCAFNADAFDYPSALSPLMRAMLLAHSKTGDEYYMAPIESMAEWRRAYLDSIGDGADTFPEGSGLWAAKEMGGTLNDVLAKNRLLNQDTRFDDLLKASGDAYSRWAFFGDDLAMTNSLQDTVNALRIDKAAYTDEVRWTDRVFKFNKNYANYFTEPEIPKVDVDLLYSMVTGDVSDPFYLPLNAVVWETDVKDIAIRVATNTTLQFSAELYHFGATFREIGANFTRLAEGYYQWSLSCDQTVVAEGAFIVSNIKGSVALTLPPKQLCQLELQ